MRSISVLKLRPFSGMFVYELIADQRAHRCVGGIEQRRLAFHGYSFGGAADGQAEIYSRLLVGLKHDAGLVKGLESVGLDRDVVRAGLERGHGIDALLVGDNVAGCAGVDALDNDARAGHGPMVGIEDVAVDGAGGRALGGGKDGQKQKTERREVPWGWSAPQK